MSRTVWTPPPRMSGMAVSCIERGREDNLPSVELDPPSVAVGIIWCGWSCLILWPPSHQAPLQMPRSCPLLGSMALPGPSPSPLGEVLPEAGLLSGHGPESAPLNPPPTQGVPSAGGGKWWQENVSMLQGPPIMPCPWLRSVASPPGGLAISPISEIHGPHLYAWLGLQFFEGC